MPLIQIVLLIYTAVGLNIRMSRGEEECWALVYKISTGGNGSAYNLFMSGDSLNVNDEEAMSLHCSNPSRKHFKSDIVNNWSTNGIDQVRVSVYVNGIEQIFLLFNGSKTNKTNWFDESRLMNSSYSDLNEQTNVSFFSVDGISGNADDSVGNYSRRFYIRNETTGNCETSDYGWLFVGDELGNCDYERKIEDKPFILFSNPPYISKVAETFTISTWYKYFVFVNLSIEPYIGGQFGNIYKVTFTRPACSQSHGSYVPQPVQCYD
ncbi:uncharacterized protein LOC127719653 isoform X2 [Mytilus californianus]|uniref:uncharacterized protein LOC127719653 isoform X2 n=1 Tax=Mytilus californianus TaxID=6549 RepID=UPI002245DAF2|nr:uncharacterized protein LOC127719653 isoform X2 [Mytilus californianus]